MNAGSPARDDQAPAAAGGPGAAAWATAFGQGIGVLVVGHGTADPVGAAESREVAGLVAAMLPGVPVELGFLEVIGPSIGESLVRLAARGCRRIVAAPLLLFTAGHAREDVPSAVREGAEMAGVEVRQAAALGCHARVVALSRLRRGRAIASLPTVSPEATALVMVGRGSSDPSAVGQLREFAEATLAPAEEPQPGIVELGFVAAARPTLAEAIVSAGIAGETGSVRRVIVQPHLLFRGHVEEQVSAAVREGRRSRPTIDWVQVDRLGPDLLVAEALVERAAQAAEGWQ